MWHSLTGELVQLLYLNRKIALLSPKRDEKQRSVATSTAKRSYRQRAERLRLEGLGKN